MPARTYPIVRTVVSGTIEAVQTWSCGFWASAEVDFINADQLHTYCVDVLAAVNAHLATSDVFPALNAPDTALTDVTGYYYPTGATKAELVAQAAEATPIVGASTSYGSTRDAVVVSLLSNLAGARNRGRLYMPATAAPLQSNHQIAQPVAQTLASAWAGILDSVNASTYAAWTPQVIVGGHTGPGVPITKCRVDTLLDSQRRRSDKLRASGAGNATLGFG